MLDVETIHPSFLSPADAALWRSLAASAEGFGNPLLGPEFAQAVGKVREDARVAVIRRGGETVGFLPFHRRPGGRARPIGAPLSDYHGLVSRPDAGLRISDVLRAAEVSVFRYSGLIDPHAVFPTSPETDRTAYLIDLTGTTVEAYLEAVRAESPKKIKNYRRLDNKLDREIGAVRLVASDFSRDAFNLLIDWKREQLARTGAHDFLRADWTRELLADLFTTRSGAMQGLMINLYAGDTLVGGHFGIRQGATYHPWIASTNPEMAAWSPGQIFFLRAIAAMPGMGLTRYDLGPGHDHYKRAYGLRTVQIGEGAATAANVAGRVAHSMESVWNLAGAHGAGPVGQLRRRMDAIASTELTMTGRVRGFVEAVAARAQRGRGEHTEA
ncbi:GNAT family N-acetyltransferase [Caulobacter vibrioides]|uniref:GNAT family N-acetyltransferase n=1 Tax=Caulobacter vibrioides TaxID=155892 RepID=UPI000BB46EE1|nr:GNAT family N-acetyltransferase [Caulobacter vibrioides]ATC25283.1 GNAT family N-acetyltransferase [Caulobacter vibrioides]AZH14821.1 GNAT family N-acetyltransferase [Caulobacter vibrioides]PLR14147.1 GNAT family N-acetyltransferase [Caulobacter vibrioides]